MVEITNTTFQYLFIPIKYPTGIVDISIPPKCSVKISSNYESKVLQTLLKRRQVKVKVIK